MSIAMELFGSSERTSESPESSGGPGPNFPFQLQCRTCGFEPIDVIAPPPCCPKCTGHSWERFAIARSLLMHADRSVKRGPLRNQRSPEQMRSELMHQI